MSCACGAETMAGCPSMQLAAAELPAELGADEVAKVWRAMWCLLHPTQCRRDPVTGRPRLALDDLVVLGAVVIAWHVLTRDG